MDSTFIPTLYNIKMKIIINNDITTIEDISDSLRDKIHSTLKYVDKSKQYQLKRLSKSTWGLRSPQYAKLKNEVNGLVYKILDNGNYEISSCFYKDIVEGVDADIVDNRKTTGKTIALPWVKKPHDLRDYQEEGAEIMANNYRGLINMATGLGKTLLALHVVKRTKKKSLIVCPSQSVAQQFYEQLVETFGSNRVGMFGGGKKNMLDITVGIAASVNNHIEDFKKHDLGLIIIDEVHHLSADTFFNIAEGLASVGKIFGLTATDYRSDGKDILINAGCGPVLIRKDIVWGIEQGWLAEPYFIVREIETGAYDYKEDKLKSYKAHVLNCEKMKDQIFSDAKKFIDAGKHVLILTDEVAHGEELSNQLGVPFAQGEDKNSQEYVNQLNRSEIKGLVGSDGKISEGTDTKNVDVLILANFVASKGPVIQAVGRALRKTPTKDKCLILDYKIVSSTMLSRHADNRIGFYQEITDKVIVHKLQP